MLPAVDLERLQAALAGEIEVVGVAETALELERMSAGMAEHLEIGGIETERLVLARLRHHGDRHLTPQSLAEVAHEAVAHAEQLVRIGCGHRDGDATLETLPEVPKIGGMITSRHNRRLKDMRQAARCKGDLALLEGPHLVAEAVAAGVELDDVLASPEFLRSAAGTELAAILAHPPEPVDGDLLASFLDADSPRGIAALGRLSRPEVAALPRHHDGLYLYLAGVQDPGNLGALARSAEAAGASALALAPGSVHPNHPRALRASAGSLLRIPVAVAVEAAALELHLAPLAPRRIALATHGGSDLWSADLDGTLILQLGAEGQGLPAALAQRADLALTIPLTGRVESLNVTVAASLVLFEVRRRRLASAR